MTRSLDTNTPDSPLLLTGHCLDLLRDLPDESVDSCVTSPPYWGLRDYGTEPQVWGGRSNCRHKWSGVTVPAANGSAAMLGVSPKPHSATRYSRGSSFCLTCGAWKGSLGLEPTPGLYVEHLVEVFREVRRVLKKEGTLWLVLGDCFAGSWGNYGSTRTGGSETRRPGRPAAAFVPPQAVAPGLKRKDLVGIPWQVAFALRGDGWYLRSDIVWNKPNAVPESARDRPTRAHEFVFLFAKSRRYYYDWEAIAEPLAESSLRRLRQASFDRQAGGPKDYATAAAGGGPDRSARKVIVNLKGRALPGGSRVSYPRAYRKNRRSVWTLPTHPYPGEHFATYPPELVRPCVLAGSPPDGVVLDPFAGAATTGMVAREEGRRFIGVELNPGYVGLARERLGSAATRQR